jgi:thioesterase domain-containing protein/acyl carrier protein
MSSAETTFLRFDPPGRRMTRTPASLAVEVLTPIWERVLQRSPILIDDNFFDLGGDSLVAVQLFSEIERECGRQLAPVTIYCAPTIASLAAVLDEPTAPRFPPLLLLKPGNELPPVFLAHGLGGTAMDFYQFVKHLEIDRPIYGMQAQGADGVDEPFDRIEDLAQFHLDAIRELQPHGPYYLIGYSLGGLVTLEMAHRLTEAGEKVALLALLETYPHASFLSTAQRARLATRAAKNRASAVGRLPVRDALSYFIRPSERRLNHTQVSNGNARNQLPVGVAITPTMQRARDSAYAALARYRPRFYSGTIKFVRAETVSDFPDDPAAVWSGLADKFQVETVPGDHLGILGTHFANLASAISRYLRETSS